MTVFDRPIAVLSRVNDGIERIGKHAGLSLVAAMTIVILMQVVFRYVFNNALSWSEEVARYMMVWMTFLVAPIAYRKGLNVGLDLLGSVLPARAMAVLGIVIHVLVILLILALFRETIGMLDRGLRITAQTFQVPMFYIYLAVPLGYAAMILAGLELVLRAVRDLGQPPSAPAAHAPPFEPL